MVVFRHDPLPGILQQEKKKKLLLNLELWPLSGKRMKMWIGGELFCVLKQTAEL